MNYKYYLALTSQLPFCSVPLRLDTYNSCQFSCSYCFAKARGGAPISGATSEASHSALRQRLSRASEGAPKGAVEEFLQQRIPHTTGRNERPI